MPRRKNPTERAASRSRGIREVVTDFKSLPESIRNIAIAAQKIGLSTGRLKSKPASVKIDGKLRRFLITPVAPKTQGERNRPAKVEEIF